MKSNSFLSPSVLLGVLILAIGVIYAANSAGELMFDDDHQIIYASGFSSVSDTFSVDFLDFFRPVKNLVFYFWINVFPDQYQLWRLSALLAFLGLIPIAHAFFGLFWKNHPYLQLFCTALWASAPALTTVVSWISSTNIIIGGYGFFLYFLFYEKAHRQAESGEISRSYVWTFLSLLMLALSCFSYETSITAPFLLGLKVFSLNHERVKNKRSWLFFLLSLFVLVIYLLLRKIHGGVTTFGMASTLPSDSDFWVSLSSGWMYLFHSIRWIWPFGHQGILIMFNPENHKVLVVSSAILVLGIGVALLYIRNRDSKLFLGLGWYAMALFPMANVIPLRNGPIADYYLFFPSVGLALFMARALQAALNTSWRKVAISAAIIWVLIFCTTTLMWVPHWKSQRALAERTESWQPENFVILESLAKVELEDKQYDKAMAYLDRGLKFGSWYSRLHYYKVMVFIEQNKGYEAKELLEMLAEHESTTAKPFVFQAYVYEKLFGQLEKSEALLRVALDNPWNDRYSRMGAMNLAAIYLKTGRAQFAIKVYESLIARYPGDTEIAE